MGLPVTVYRHTDVGAPQLDGKVGTLLNIIQKALVDGYGSKPGLGWTRIFYDAVTGSVIYRNNTVDGGSGGVVRFSTTDLISVNKMIRIQVAKDASDVNTLIQPLPFLERYVNSSTTSWEIIGTSRGFYLNGMSSSSLNMNYETSAQWLLFLGDIISYWQNDSGEFTMVTGVAVTVDQTINSASYNLGGNSTINAMLYNTDNTDTILNYKVQPTPWQYQNSNSTYNNTQPIENNLTVTLTPAVLANTVPTSLDANGVMNILSKVSPMCRGQIAGLYISPMGCYSQSNRPVDVVFGGVNYTRLLGSYGSLLWVNTVEWY